MATMTINNHHHHSPTATGATNKMNSLYGGGSVSGATGIILNGSTGNLSTTESNKGFILRPSANSMSANASSYSVSSSPAASSIYRNPIAYYHPQSQSQQYSSLTRPNIPIVTNKFPANYQQQSPIMDKSNSTVNSSWNPVQHKYKIMSKSEQSEQQQQQRKMAPPLEFVDNDHDESIINFEDSDFCDKLRKIVDRLNDVEYQRLYRLMHQRFKNMSKPSSVTSNSNVSSSSATSSVSSSISSISSSDNSSGGHSTNSDENQLSNSPVPANYNEEDPHTWPSNWQSLAPQIILAPEQYLRQKPTLNDYQRSLIRRISHKHQPLVWKCLKQLAIELEHGTVVPLSTDHSHSIQNTKILATPATTFNAKQHATSVPTSSTAYSLNPSTKTIIDSINSNHHRIFYYYPNQRINGSYYEPLGPQSQKPSQSSIKSMLMTSANNQNSIHNQSASRLSSSASDCGASIYYEYPKESENSGADYLKLRDATPPSPPPASKSQLPPQIGPNEVTPIANEAPIIVNNNNNGNLSSRLSSSMQLNKWSSKMKIYLRKNPN